MLPLKKRCSLTCQTTAELGDVDGGVDQVRIDPLPVGNRVGLPLVEGTFGEAKHPAGHGYGTLSGPNPLATARLGRPNDPSSPTSDDPATG